MKSLRLAFFVTALVGAVDLCAAFASPVSASSSRTRSAVADVVPTRR